MHDVIHYIWHTLFPPDKPFDFIALLVLSNLILSTTHSLLEWSHQKTKNKWDDRFYRITGYLLNLTEFAMAARVGKRLAPREKGKS